MKWNVVYTAQALKDLKKLDRFTASFITGWVRKKLMDCENPRALGKPLTANRRGQWRYRIGDYRLIAEIKENELIILALSIGHRRDIYD